MKQEQKEPWYTSITAIVILLICFWPIGLVLLYLRLIRTKGKYNTTSNLLLTGAIFLIFIGIVGLSAFFDTYDISDLLLATLMFLAPGGFCGYLWYKRRKKYAEYKIYLEYINARKRVKLDSLCNRLNVDYDTAVKNLTEMINKGLINGYLTDDDLIVNDIMVDEVDNLEVNIKSLSKETKVIKCKECGAKNTVVVGEHKECDYCGTILQ